MNFLLTLVILIIILGLIVFIHELGHFIAAKKSGVHVYEFAIGMGPKIFSFKRKNDPTIYSLRLLPLGGFNAIASTMETCEGVKESEVLENKSGFKRFAVLVMGIVFNFILSIILLFINGLIYGSPVTSPYLGNVLEGSAAELGGLKENDLILKINDKSVNSWDDVLLETKFGKDLETYTFLVNRNGEELTINVSPTYKEVDGEKTKEFGFSSSTRKEKGFVNALKYGFVLLVHLIY